MAALVGGASSALAVLDGFRSDGAVSVVCPPASSAICSAASVHAPAAAVPCSVAAASVSMPASSRSLRISSASILNWLLLFVPWRDTLVTFWLHNACPAGRHLSHSTTLARGKRDGSGRARLSEILAALFLLATFVVLSVARGAAGRGDWQRRLGGRVGFTQTRQARQAPAQTAQATKPAQAAHARHALRELLHHCLHLAKLRE